ncbi:MAG: hypothetical protein AAFR59_05375 [Bacteroidota bacterium]
MIPSNDSHAPWPWFTYKQMDDLHLATDQLHRAAQFVAMTGKIYLPPEDDDSQTNMGWLVEDAQPAEGILVGNPLEVPEQAQFHVGLRPADSSLLFLQADDREIMAELSLGGKTRDEVEEWHRGQLEAEGLDASAFHLNLHYEIPPHPIDRGQAFQFSEELAEAFQAFAVLRHLGHKVVSYFAEFAPHGADTATWPHHFDTGAYIPLAFEQEKPVKAIGLGLAVPDDVMPEYYFYITHQAPKGSVSYESLPGLPAGVHWNKMDWHGPVLPLSSLISTKSAEAQHELIHDYFQKGIQETLQLIGEPLWEFPS